MSIIAATASSNYAPLASAPGANASSGAIAALAQRLGSRADIVADVVARLLQSTTADSAPSANSSAAIILTQLLSSTNQPSTLANRFSSANGAALMELNLNQLLNSATLQKAIAQLPPELLARPQVIQALVLQNTLLPAPANRDQLALPLLIVPSANNAPPSTPPTLYRVNLEWQNRLIELLSPQPLPTGARVALQVDPGGQGVRAAITLLPPELAAKILLAQKTSAPVANAPPPTSLIPNSTQLVQQSLRELLPRQQALHTLMPLLQKFAAPALREQLPPPIAKTLAQLLNALPKPEQLRTAETIKQAINNSGSFLEAKIAQAAARMPGAEPLPNIAATDIKAQIAALLALLRQFAPAAPAKPAAPAMNTPLNAGEDFVYAKPSLQNAGKDAKGGHAPTADSEPLDVLLAQLGKLLQAGFARIQSHQLDSIGARHSGQEAQAPVPTWVLELPLRTAQGFDQLQLRIEQHRQRHQQRARVQWNVEIAFDLHAAGKLAASLAIVEKSVSATLWAEQEQTHRRVREEMDYLRAGLESVGVKVTDMQCRHGLPTPRSHPISQQLVDIHT